VFANVRHMFESAHAELKAADPSGATRAHLEAGLAEFGRLEARLAERRMAWMAALDRIGDGGRESAGVMHSMGRRSTRGAKRSARIAEGLHDMPRFREALASGSISEEHVDHAVRAAERVDAATVDEELTRRAQEVPADLFAKTARRWADRHEPRDGASSRRERQRRKRSFRSWNDADGMYHFRGALDQEAGSRFAAAVAAHKDKLWRADGGRDGTAEEVRNNEQRAADAVVELVTADGVSGPVGKRHPKHQAIAVIDVERLDWFDTLDEGARAEIVRGGPLPQCALQRLMCDASVAPMIVNRRGQALWLGQAKDTASDAQWKALVARDAGCVVCGAEPSMCEAHHVVFRRDRGPTDIDNLVLLCTYHHHELHDRGLTLQRARARPDRSASRNVNESVRAVAWELVPDRDGPPRSRTRRSARAGPGPATGAASWLGSPPTATRTVRPHR